MIDDRLITLYLEIVIAELFTLLFLIKAICRRCDEFICRQVSDEQTPEGAGASTVSTPKEAGFSLCFDRHEWLLHVRSQKTIFLELLFEVDRLPR